MPTWADVELFDATTAGDFDIEREVAGDLMAQNKLDRTTEVKRELSDDLAIYFRVRTDRLAWLDEMVGGSDGPVNVAALRLLAVHLNLAIACSDGNRAGKPEDMNPSAAAGLYYRKAYERRKQDVFGTLIEPGSAVTGPISYSLSR